MDKRTILLCCIIWWQKAMHFNWMCIILKLNAFTLCIIYAQIQSIVTQKSDNEVIKKIIPTKYNFT